eukprot:tig00000190_g13874.t1
MASSIVARVAILVFAVVLALGTAEAKLPSPLRIINNKALPTFGLPGLVHQSIATKPHHGSNVDLWRETIIKNAWTPIHLHVKNEEYIHVISGTFSIRTLDGVYHAGVNDTVHLDKGVIHQVGNVDDADAVALVVISDVPTDATVRPAPPGTPPPARPAAA